MDILIKNGTVFDGTAAPPRKADVAISKGRIASIGAFADIQAGRIIDAKGLYVAPGFIDIENHSDSYLTLLKTPSSESLLRQGITTVLIGNCGSSLAPMIRGDLIAGIQKWADISGVNINWERFGEFFEILAQKRLGVNVASLVGHATLRRGFLDHAMREADEKELKKMIRLLDDALREGACGLSYAPAYLHGRPAGKSELTPLVERVAEANGLFSVHLRDEGVKIIDSLEEILAIVKEVRVRTEISHLKIAGPDAWHLADRVFEMIERAREESLSIHFDFYPYMRSGIVLYLLFPHWAQEGGRNAMLARLKDNDERARIIEEIQEGRYRDILGAIRVGTAHRDRTFAGKLIVQLAKNQGVSEAEALVNVFVANEGRVSVFVPDIAKDHLLRMFKHEASFFGTAGGGYDLSWRHTVEHPHPRSFGAFPRALAIGARTLGMPWEILIEKMTSGPAAHIGLLDRGTLREGFAADVVVFDPLRVGSKATFTDPYQYSRGIHYVLVNGVMAVGSKGLTNEMNGKVLRRS